MAQRTLTEAEALREFWEQLANTGTVMLGVNAVDRHSQPMAAFSERDENAVWFFTRDDTEIAIEAAEGCDGRLTMVSRDRKVYADISGTLATAHDPERVERYWGPTVAAWWPPGIRTARTTLTSCCSGSNRLKVRFGLLKKG
jgi:general stress protein 26